MVAARGLEVAEFVPGEELRKLEEIELERAELRVVRDAGNAAEGGVQASSGFNRAISSAWVSSAGNWGNSRFTLSGAWRRKP